MAKNTLKILDPSTEKRVHSWYREVYEFEIHLHEQSCTSECPNCPASCKHSKGHSGQHSCGKGHKWS